MKWINPQRTIRSKCYQIKRSHRKGCIVYFCTIRIDTGFKCLITNEFIPIFECISAQNINASYAYLCCFKATYGKGRVYLQ